MEIDLCENSIIHLDPGANFQDIQLSYDILATESEVPDVGPRSRCIMVYAQMVWLITLSINFAVLVKKKTTSGACFKFYSGVSL